MQRPYALYIGQFRCCWGLLAIVASLAASSCGLADANRLNYLDEFCDPFYPSQDFPKLITPQWVGEAAIEAAVILSIEGTGPYDELRAYLRPIMRRLVQIEGRAPLTILAEQEAFAALQAAAWLPPGVALEPALHTQGRPLLVDHDLGGAKARYGESLDALVRAGNTPVLFRAPGCDRFNAASPRLYSEIILPASAAGNFVAVSSSVGQCFTLRDAELTGKPASDQGDQAGFLDYVPEGYVNLVRNYPYPYVISRRLWEFPFTIPGGRQSQQRSGKDLISAFDLTVAGQGVFVLALDPQSGISAQEVVNLIDHATRQQAGKIKFMTFREAHDRINRHLLDGEPLRTASGDDNGVRLIDVDDDGYLDVVIGNENLRRTKLWKAIEQQWAITEFPTALIEDDSSNTFGDAGVRFGVLQENGFASAIQSSDETHAAWDWDGSAWQRNQRYLRGLQLTDQHIYTSVGGRDRGVRLRDVNLDGRCEAIVGNESQNALFEWSADRQMWAPLSFALPENTSIVDAVGRDNGLRLVDINGDGYQDVIFSNPTHFSLHVYIEDPALHYAHSEVGWKRPVVMGRRGDRSELPPIIRDETKSNGGAWFADGQMWVHSEFTSQQPGYAEHHTREDLLSGFLPPPLSPAESLKTIHVPRGFEVELVAAEPLVVDPVAIDWGSDGKLWVVEMRDYPLGLDGKGTPGGVVRVLEDRDHDGKYDHSTIFLDKLNFPTGVMPWRDGALVSAAPEIIYAEDTDGDGRADVRKTLFAGFELGNQQHRVNGFAYGLDNWIYVANGHSGGQIESLRTGAVVDIDGYDLRIQPDTGLLERQAGRTEFGRHRDDWGNWFGNTYANWGYHFFMPIHYLDRNRHVPVEATRHDLAQYPNARRIFRLSEMMTRPHMGQPLDHVTSPCSVAPYRDELFGPQFASTVFISEVDKNIIHREILTPDGVTLSGRRAAEDQQREFLASTDNWFRPAQSKTGPDGALYIADMYRLIIEHEEFYPDDLRKTLDFRAGDDKGRIYRVYPTGAQLPRVPRLDSSDTAALVKAIDSPNGWQRDTAQRLLVQTADPFAVEPLEHLAQHSDRAKTRLQALCTLDGMSALTPRIVMLGLADKSAYVRQHAVRVSEHLLDGSLRAAPNPDAAAVQFDRLTDALLALVDDPSIRVRFQLAFSLGELTDPRAAAALARLAIGDLHNEQIQIAVLSSATGKMPEMFAELLTLTNLAPPLALIERWLGVATAMGDDDALCTALAAIGDAQQRPLTDWRYAALAAFLDSLNQSGGSLFEFNEQASPQLQTHVGSLSPIFRRAYQVAIDDSAPPEQRQVAIRLFGRGVASDKGDIGTLIRLAAPDVPSLLQHSALENLAHRREPEVASWLLDHWDDFGPTLRADIVRMLTSRLTWSKILLTRMQQGSLSAAEIGLAQRQALLTSSDESVRVAAELVFGEPDSERAKVVADYGDILSLSGDAARGASLYTKHCGACHRFRNQGAEIGPALDDIASKSWAATLQNILDPNRVVEPSFVSYVVLTDAGRKFTGIVANETPTSITLKSVGESPRTLLRNDIDEIRSTGVSLMPVGFERELDQQALADLLTWLTSGMLDRQGSVP